MDTPTTTTAGDIGDGWAIKDISRQTLDNPWGMGEPDPYTQVRLEHAATDSYLKVTRFDGETHWSIDAAIAGDRLLFSTSPGGRLEGGTSTLPPDMANQLGTQLASVMPTPAEQPDPPAACPLPTPAATQQQPDSGLSVV